MEEWFDVSLVASHPDQALILKQAEDTHKYHLGVVEQNAHLSIKIKVVFTPKDYEECRFGHTCRLGYLELAQVMLSANRFGADYAQSSSFVWAADAGHLAFAQWLYSLFHHPVETFSEAFIFAAGKNHLSTAKWLLQEKPNLNKNFYQASALQMACESNHREAMDWLLSLGPEITDNFEHELLSLVERAAFAGVQYLLEQRPAFRPTLNDPETFELIFAYDSPPDAEAISLARYVLSLFPEARNFTLRTPEAQAFLASLA